MTSEASFDVAPTWLAYLRKPWALLVVLGIAIAMAIWGAQSFRFDASSEALVVDGDPDLAAYEEVIESFGGDDFLLLTYQPRSGSPFSPAALETLHQLTDELRALDGVSNVFSVLDVPLLKSPPMSLAEMLEGFRTLRSADVDLALAQVELAESQFFRELLVSANADSTAIKINLSADDTLLAVTEQRESLGARLSNSDRAAIEKSYREARVGYLAQRERLIEAIRAIQRRYQQQGTLYLGGVPMIAADMITYVQADLATFGGTVIVLMVAALALFFRRVRWVVLPLITAALAVLLTVGAIGTLGWQATVISSNFISLLAITTISLTIHLIVHYRELIYKHPESSHQALTVETMRAKFAPCFYTALTTMAAFGSLTVSGILPVQDFGWMMCIGIALSFVSTYTLFPAVLLLLPKGKPSSNLGTSNSFIRSLGEMSRWRPGMIALLALIAALASYAGISQISLDNRFAEYFDEETEIYQGMRFIDQNLGGTIPLDVVLRFDPYEPVSFDEDDDFAEDGDFTAEYADEFEDDFEDDFGDPTAADAFPERYWFERRKLDALESMHRFLEAQPQIGKVLSLTALEDFAREFNDGDKLSNVAIAGILGAIPSDLLGELIHPFGSPQTGELRLSARIVESGPSFDRQALRAAIENHAVTELKLAPEDVTVTGMMVLFNSMLSQLLDSQISTLVYILGVVFVMFLVLLRSLPLALLGMIPNTLASAMVLGTMGFAGIPLDMMTTTIAAICIGIGVDDTIHYLHRFREETRKHGDARVAVSFTHATIGRAMYYTSLTVIAGFSVLAFSNFVPTVMFGVWTAVAMSLALLANLTLLPALLVLTRAQPPLQPVVKS